MRGKRLLLTAVAVELPSALALLVAPSRAIRLLLGVGLDSPAAVVVARIAGFLLVALSLAWWLARDLGRDGQRPGIAAFLFYNVAAALLFAHAAWTQRMPGFGLWVAIAVHTVLALSCWAWFRSAASDGAASATRRL